MKKILIGIMVFASVFLLVGCDSKEEKIEEKNEYINDLVEESVKNGYEVETLQELDSNILMTSLGLDADEVEEYIGKIPVYNNPVGTMYIAIKPKKGSEKRVKKMLDLYVNTLELKLSENEDELKKIKDKTKQEYKGYYIYVSGSEKDTILKILKDNIK